MKNQTAVMCHNIAKYNRENPMPNEMNVQEAANALEAIIEATGESRSPYYISLMEYIHSILSRVASGELVPAPVRCIDCLYGDVTNLKIYPDMLCSLKNKRVDVGMSCSCGKYCE